MAVPTSSSNGRAVASLLFALLGVLVVPAAVVLTQQSKSIDLLEAAYALPFAAVLGVVALVLAVGARRKAEWTLGRSGGARAARLGRILGVLALCIAAAGGIAVGWYAILVHYS